METTIATVHNDLIYAADADRVTALVLLDLSSAFDTVDHDILSSVLERRFGCRRRRTLMVPVLSRRSDADVRR